MLNHIIIKLNKQITFSQTNQQQPRCSSESQGHYRMFYLASTKYRKVRYIWHGKERMRGVVKDGTDLVPHPPLCHCLQTV